MDQEEEKYIRQMWDMGRRKVSVQTSMLSLGLDYGLHPTASQVVLTFMYEYDLFLCDIHSYLSVLYSRTVLLSDL